MALPQDARKKQNHHSPKCCFDNTHFRNPMKSAVDIISVLLLADGKFGDSEKQFLKLIEAEAELKGLSKQVQKKITELQDADDDYLTEVLYNAGKQVEDYNKSRAFELGIATILSDGVVKEQEVSSVLTLADSLEIPLEKAIMRLLLESQERQGNLIIDVEEELEDFFIVSGKTRYRDFAAFEAYVLKARGYSSELIEALREIDSWIKGYFPGKANTGYGPNFLTGGIVNPSGRHKNFTYIKLQKDHVAIECNGSAYKINTSADFTIKIKAAMVEYFNMLSKDKVR